jgi:hypothetical protein
MIVCCVQVYMIPQNNVGVKRKQKRVLYFDQTELDKGHTTLFCGKKKQDPKAKSLKLVEIKSVQATEDQPVGITIQHEDEPLQLLVDCERSRNHVVRMLRKLVDTDMWQRRFMKISKETHRVEIYLTDPATNAWPQPPLQSYELSALQSLTRGGPDQRLMFLRFPGEAEITLRANNGDESTQWFNALNVRRAKKTILYQSVDL